MKEKINYPSNEFELLSDLQELLSGLPQNDFEVGIGDDAAVRRCSNKEKLIFTTDISVENVHFKTDYLSLREIGYRAMVSNLSDCAAMGATPDSALIQLTFPKCCCDLKKSIMEVYCGFKDACDHWKFPIVGGDLSSGPVWVIGITLIGKINSGKRTLRRSGIHPGDSLWVSGPPGCSAAGLACLNRWGRSGVPIEHSQLVESHIAPVPQIEYGLSLLENEHVHAMMDLSDGLSKDCRTLAFENDLGLILFSDASHIPPAMVKLSVELGIPWENWYFHGGEEYELLFAASDKFDPSQIKGAEPFIRIGVFTGENLDISVKCNGLLRTLEKGSFDHLG